MKKFMDENFLLNSHSAQILYHEYAKHMPILDYHCHLDPHLIAQNHKFETITQLWLQGDHYKWRAMRTNGVDEKYITGDATDFEKFEKWAETIPYTVRNPLFHWSHLELKNVFGIEERLCKENAKEIYNRCNELLATDDFSCQRLIEKSNVNTLCTTDDPCDSLAAHQQIKKSSFSVQVLPAWRPDKVCKLKSTDEYREYIKELGDISETPINNIHNLISALDKRHQYFHENGCRLSDHGMESFYLLNRNIEEIDDIFRKALEGDYLFVHEKHQFEMFLLYELAKMDYKRGWTQQFHIGALRDNNLRLHKKIGSDIGCDSIGDILFAEHLSSFLGNLDSEEQLTKTILYNLNPAWNEVLGTMIGNFQDATIPGKIQLGSGWWFLDQKEGMTQQINTLSNLGLLSRFVGMLTDSRSFISYSRHEYFRRILCNLIGTDIENGEIPNDIQWIGKMIEDICYNNAEKYFKF